MRKLLARVGLPVLVAALLPLAGLLSVTLRTDIESDTAIFYSDAGAHTIAPGTAGFRLSPIVDSPGPHPRGRARIDAPGYSEYMYSPAF